MTKTIATVLPKWAQLHLAASINPCSEPLPHSKFGFSTSHFLKRIHKSRPRVGEHCGATIFYPIRETRVMTKSIATVLPKWA